MSTTTTSPPHDPDPDLEPLPGRPRRRFATPLGAALAGLLIAALGFLGGVEAQKHRGGSTTSSGATGLRSGGFAARAAAFAGRGGAAGGSAPTTGTVASKRGRILYVKETSGTVVRVTPAKGAQATRTASAGISAIHPGDTVIVQGATAKSGAVTATRVTATAKGAAAAGGLAGGFPGGGRFGGGSPSGAPTGGG
jgi:hypothetical protein